MAEENPQLNRPHDILPLGATNELLHIGGDDPVESYRPPSNLEEWRELAHASMNVLAELGTAQIAEQGITLDPHQSLPLNTLGIAKVDFHEGSTEAGKGKSQDFEGAPHQRIVKIAPIPQMPIPPANAPMSVMAAAARKYQGEVEEKAEIMWSSLTGEITVARRTPDVVKRDKERNENEFLAYSQLAQGVKDYHTEEAQEAFKSIWNPDEVAATEAIPLDQLSPDDQVRFCEITRGAATIAAVAARRPDLVARLQHIWEPDL